MTKIKRQDVKVVTIGEIGILDTMTWDESIAFLREYCERENATYYAAPRERFSIESAKTTAAALGKTIVVVEDLS